MAVTGVVALAVVAVWVAGSVLRPDTRPAPGSPGTTARPPQGATVRMEADGWQVVQIIASDRYSPGPVVARSGVPTVLEILSEGAGGCLRSFLIPSRGVERHLPVDGLTRVNLGTPQAGTLDFSCGTGAAGGRIEFRDGA
jgi:plastocyanin domain-containing protein